MATAAVSSDAFSAAFTTAPSFCRGWEREIYLLMPTASANGRVALVRAAIVSAVRRVAFGRVLVGLTLATVAAKSGVLFS